MTNTVWKPKPTVRTSAPDHVINQIKKGLIDHTLNPGDRLPSETETAEIMGVSRGSVRQAMKSLETMGILSIKPGDGTYINDSIHESSMNLLVFALLIARPSMNDIVSFRYALERDVFELVLENKDGIGALTAQLEENIQHHEELIRNKASVEELVINDRNFHSLLSKGSGNLMLSVVYDFVMEYFGEYMLKTTSRQESVGINYAVRDHKNIVQALRAGDKAALDQALNDSVATWRQYLGEEDFT